MRPEFLTRLICVAGALAAWLALQPFPGALLADEAGESEPSLRIGWAQADMTPEEPTVLTGSSVARISQGVSDPIGATVLVLQSDGDPPNMVVLVSVDLCLYSQEFLEGVRTRVREAVPEIDTDTIVISATHTHVAPETRTSAPDMVAKLTELGIEEPVGWSVWGIDLGVMSPEDYVEFATTRIAEAIQHAWEQRQRGGISFGLSHAVAGHNRLTRYRDGRSRMYGATDREDFSHIEGYEDHSVDLLCTWDTEGQLTGVLINLAVPSQVSGGSRITADFWHEVGIELRQRLGDSLFVLPQCAAAGDQGPTVMVHRRAEDRMQRLMGRSRRQMIAVRIADAVTSILPTMEQHIDWEPVLAHRKETVELSRRRLTAEDVESPRGTHHRPQSESVQAAFERLLGDYRRMRQQLEEEPERRQEGNWYSPITSTYWRLWRASRVLDRYRLQETQPTVPFDIHVIRIGDMAMATNPFELYLDFGMQLKARSRAVQTFVVQLAGGQYAQYLPTARAVSGGAYGAIPESTEIGPEGGRELVEQTLALIATLWDDD